MSDLASLKWVHGRRLIQRLGGHRYVYAYATDYSSCTNNVRTFNLNTRKVEFSMHD